MTKKGHMQSVQKKKDCKKDLSNNTAQLKQSIISALTDEVKLC